MRDTKYRAWYEKSQTWVYWTIGKTWTKLGHEVYEELCLNGSDFYEWTGLKDKNGTDIYEGDIVKKPNDLYIGDESVGKNKGTFVNDAFIEYVEGTFRLNKLSHKSKNYYGVINYTRTTHASVIEVIGNIHSNPELL